MFVGVATSKENRNEEKKNMKKNEHDRKETKNNEAPTEDFVIEKIIDHKINTSRRHRYSKEGEPLYRVRCYAFETDEDT